MTSAADRLLGLVDAGPRACPQCGGTAARELPKYSTPVWHVVACATCGFVFLKNPPPAARLAEEFSWEKTYDQEAVRRREARPAVAWVERKTRPGLRFFRRDRGALYRTLFRPGRVLDVGCGDGSGVPEPFIPFGIEISKALYEKASARMSQRGGRVVRGPASEVIRSFPDGFFTGVILSSVLEHESEPRKLLAGVRRVLTADGSAYVRVPNFGGINRRVNGAKWCGFRHPDHVNYFTVASLRKMAAFCGLAVRLLNPVRLPLDDNINAVLTRL